MSVDVIEVMEKWKGQELTVENKSKIYDDLDKLHKQELIYHIIAEYEEKDEDGF